jgi:hypothetical protein
MEKAIVRNPSEIVRLQRLLKGSDKNPWLSLAQAARQVNMPLSTLAEAARQERLPTLVMPDMRRYVRLADVKAYLERTRRATKASPTAGDALLEIAKLASVIAANKEAPLPADFSTEHDHYLYGTPKRKGRKV